MLTTTTVPPITPALAIAVAAAAAVPFSTPAAGTESFYAFRLEAANAGGGDPVAGLQTASGLRLGDTVTQLEAAYSTTYSVNLTQRAPEGDIFEILNLGMTLISGLIISADPEGVVEGIFSPVGCSV